MVAVCPHLSIQAYFITDAASECTTSRVVLLDEHIHAQFLMLASYLFLSCGSASDPMEAEEATPSFEKQTLSRSPGKTYIFYYSQVAL